MEILSKADIARVAADAADAGADRGTACPWPENTVATELFHEAFDARREQLQSMKEAA